MRQRRTLWCMKMQFAVPILSWLVVVCVIVVVISLFCFHILPTTITITITTFVETVRFGAEPDYAYQSWTKTYSCMPFRRI